VVKRAAKEKPAERPRPRPLLKAVLTLGVAAALLGGVWWAGAEARKHIGPRDRYAVPFADLRCDPPPGSTREAFLAEVRYASGAPASVQALDPDLTAKLIAYFAAHPWVASVDAVTVEGPDAVRVSLSYRVPVLAVGERAVDARGVLLPATAPTAGLPELLGVGPLPEGVAGKPHPDATVVRAAAVAAEYRPRTVEPTAQGWQLVMPDGKKLAVAR
jgi:hypothetical protein